MLSYFGTCECLHLGAGFSGDPQAMRALSKDELDALTRRHQEAMRPCTDAQRLAHERRLANAAFRPSRRLFIPVRHGATSISVM